MSYGPGRAEGLIAPLTGAVFYDTVLPLSALVLPLFVNINGTGSNATTPQE